MLIFRRLATAPQESEPATKRVWFYEVQNDAYDPDKIQGGGRPETPERNDIPALLSAWAEYRDSRFEFLPGMEASAVCSPGSDPPRAWWASFETVPVHEFNLAGSSYKPRAGENTIDEDPAELIREALPIGRGITAGFEKLLKEASG